MEKERLKTLSCFISEVDEYVYESKNYERGCELIFYYNNLLKKRLWLGLLIPCDDNGNVLEKPKDHEDVLVSGSRVYHWNDIELSKEYQQAKNKVLFEGFEVKEDKLLLNGEDTGLITRSGNIYYDGDDIYELRIVEDLTVYGVFTKLNHNITF